MSRIVTYETDADADMSTAAAAGEEETPLLLLGGQARRSLGRLAGGAQAAVAVMSVEASSELVRLTRVIVSALTERRNGTLAAMIEALDREDAAAEKGFSSPLQEAVFLLLLRPRVLRIRPAKRHLGPLMQDLARRLQALLGMPIRPPRVVVLSAVSAPTGSAPGQLNAPAAHVTQGQQVGPRDIYREVLARVRAALTARASA